MAVFHARSGTWIWSPRWTRSLTSRPSLSRAQATTSSCGTCTKRDGNGRLGTDKKPSTGPLSLLLLLLWRVGVVCFGRLLSDAGVRGCRVPPPPPMHVRCLLCFCGHTGSGKSTLNIKLRTGETGDGARKPIHKACSLPTWGAKASKESCLPSLPTDVSAIVHIEAHGWFGLACVCSGVC